MSGEQHDWRDIALELDIDDVIDLLQQVDRYKRQNRALREHLQQRRRVIEAEIDKYSARIAGRPDWFEAMARKDELERLFEYVDSKGNS